MKKKFLKASSAFLAGLMLFSTLPLNSFAAETIYSDSYDFSHNHSEQTRYKDESGNWQDGLACYSPEYHVHTSAEGANAITVNGVDGYDKSGNCYTKYNKHTHTATKKVTDYLGNHKVVCKTQSICTGDEVYGHLHDYVDCYNQKPLYTKVDFLSTIMAVEEVNNIFPALTVTIVEVPHVHTSECEKHSHSEECFDILHVHTDDCLEGNEYVCGYEEDEIVNVKNIVVNSDGLVESFDLPDDYIGDTKISDAKCGFEQGDYVCGIEFDKRKSSYDPYTGVATGQSNVEEHLIKLALGSLANKVDDLTTIWGDDLNAHESHNETNIINDNVFSEMSKQEMQDWFKILFTTGKQTVERNGKTYELYTGSNLNYSVDWNSEINSVIYFEDEEIPDGAWTPFGIEKSTYGLYTSFQYVPEDLNSLSEQELNNLLSLLGSIDSSNNELAYNKNTNEIYCCSCGEKFTGTIMITRAYLGSVAREYITLYHNENKIEEFSNEFGSEIGNSLVYKRSDFSLSNGSHGNPIISNTGASKFLNNMPEAVQDKIWNMILNDCNVYYFTSVFGDGERTDSAISPNFGWTTGYDNFNTFFDERVYIQIIAPLSSTGNYVYSVTNKSYAYNTGKAACSNFDPCNCTEEDVNKGIMMALRNTPRDYESWHQSHPNSTYEQYYKLRLDLYNKYSQEDYWDENFINNINFYETCRVGDSYIVNYDTFVPTFFLGNLHFGYKDGYLTGISFMPNVDAVYKDDEEGAFYTFSRTGLSIPQNYIVKDGPDSWTTWNYEYYGGEIEGKNYVNMLYNECTHEPNTLLGYEFICELSEEPIYTLSCDKIEGETIESEAYQEHFHDTNGGINYKYAYISGYNSFSNFCTEPSDCFTQKLTIEGREHVHEDGVNVRTVYLKLLHQNSDLYMVCDESTPGAFQAQISEQYVYPCYSYSCVLFQDEECKQIYANPYYSSPNPYWYMMNCIDVPAGESIDIYFCTCRENSDYRDIYNLTCPYEEEEKILTATFSVDDTNQLEVSPTNLGENSEYTIEWTLPDNSTTTGSTIQGTKSGVYKAKVDVYSNIDYTDNTGTHTRKLFEGTHTFEYDLQINNKFQVHYNLELDTDPDNLLDVTADEAFELPVADVNQVPKVDGYTFDGWFTEEGNKVFNVDGSSIEDVYTYGGDIYVYVDYHKNTYKIHYNNTDVSDEVLDKLMQVVYGDAYDQIAPSPYKTGYIFTGHTLDTDEAPEVWTFAGLPKSEIWDLFAGKDNADINAYKNYDPKTFIVNFADDFNGDYVPDGDQYTEEIAYNSLWSTPSEMNNITFTGYEPSGWALSDGTSINPDDIWTIDDGKDWNTEAPDEFLVLRKWQPKTYVINYNNTTIEDTDLDKQETVVYGDAYNDIAYSPYKEGYMFEGHILKGADEYIWNYFGEALIDAWEKDNEAQSFDAIKVYKPKTIPVYYGNDFNDDNIIDPLGLTETTPYFNAKFDDTWELPTDLENPENYVTEDWYVVNPDTFESYLAATADGTKISDTWIWDDGIDWVQTGPGTLWLVRKGHEKQFTVQYNNTTVSDETLDKNIKVSVDKEYDNILVSPYKTGYIFEGHTLENTDDTIWNADGTATNAKWNTSGEDGQVFKAYKKYTPKTFTVYYGDDVDNDNQIDGEAKSFTVTYDEAWDVPFDPEVIVLDPTEIDPYVLDDWFLVEANETIINKDGSKSSDTWIWDDGKDWNSEDATTFTLVHKAHKKTYTVKYNDTTVEDTDLNKQITVYWDEVYPSISVSPYKPGYIFEGHTIHTANEFNQMDMWKYDGTPAMATFTPHTSIWPYDKGDGGIYEAHKFYYPKLVNVHFGYDYNDDNVWDEENLIPGYVEEPIPFEGDIAGSPYDLYFDAPENKSYKNELGNSFVFFGKKFGSQLPVIKTPGVTLDGYYIISDGYNNACIAKYNPETDELEFTSDTWIWDDGKNWETEEYENNIQVVAKFTKNEIPVTVYTETSEKLTPGTGNKSEYKFSVENITETFDEVYSDRTVPTKRGYDFKGYIVDPKNENEELNIWNAQAKNTAGKFLWLPAEGEDSVIVYSQFTPITVHGVIPADKYDPATNKTTPADIIVTQVYDDPYEAIPTIPEKEGYDFNGIVDKDGNPVWNKDGTPVQEIWQYLDEDIDAFTIKWMPKTYTLVYPNKVKTQEVTFGKAVPKLDTMTKTGHVFNGYTFNYFGTEIHGFDKDGKFASTTWNYDMGPSGTKVPLADVWDVATFNITVKPDAPGYNDYTVQVTYNKAYTKQTMPTKTGYFVKGYINKDDDKYIWNKSGEPVKEVYDYDRDITVTSDWQAKTFYVHCGEQVIKVTYDSSVTEKANIPTKSDYTFKSWNLKDKPLFDKDGKFTATTWTIDAGDNETHIYLDPVFEEVKKPADTPAQTPQPASNNNPVPAATPEQPHVQTGDATNVYPFILTIISFITIAGAAILINKKKHK